jgi:hypothetical protein
MQQGSRATKDDDDFLGGLGGRGGPKLLLIFTFTKTCDVAAARSKHAKRVEL